MFGLQLRREEWLLLAVGMYFLVRVGYAVGQVVSRWAVPGPPPRPPMVLALASGIAVATALWCGVALAGIPRVWRIPLYVVAVLFGCFLGFVGDIMFGVRTGWLSTWLAASAHLTRFREQLTSDDDATRVTAAKRLYELGTYAAPAVPELLAAAKDGSAGVRAHAFLALLSTLSDDDEVMAAARTGLADGDARVRAAAAMVLVRAEKAPAADVLPALAEGLMLADELFAGNALLAIGELGEDAAPAVGAVRAAVFDREPPLPYAVYTLQHLGAAAVPVLIEVLKRGPNADRQAAAWVLGEMGDKATEALPALREATASQDLGTKTAAETALTKLGAVKR